MAGVIITRLANPKFYAAGERNKDMVMASAIEVARYFLWLAEQEPEPSPITHLQLQKLLYYTQGWSLVSREQPVFREEIQAWTHGPVVGQVYRVFEKYKKDWIPVSEAMDSSALPYKDARLIRAVWESYKKYSAPELRKMTHAEAPWVNAREGILPDQPSERVIPIEAIKSYFESEYNSRSSGSVSLERLRESRRAIAAGKGKSAAEIRRSIAAAASTN